MDTRRARILGVVFVFVGASVVVPVHAVADATPTAEPTTYSSSVPEERTATTDGTHTASLERANVPVTNHSDDSPQTTVSVSYTYRRLPERHSVVEVTMRLNAPADIDRVEIDFRNESTIREATGLVRNGTTYELSGTTATVVYRWPINVTFLGTTGDSWTLIGHLPPEIDTDPDVRVVENTSVDGDGYVANSTGAGYTTVLLGEHDIYRRTIDEETIELAVPAGVSLLYGPNRTIGALANASRSLDIDGADGVVSAVATPEIVVGYNGREPVNTAIQPGESLIIVEAEAILDAWIHEYVHTRQPYKPAPEGMEWLSEGSARYYQALVSVEHGYGNWRTLTEVFSRASAENAVLAEPDTWSGETAYAKGALVLAAIDREIRSATDGNRTVQDVLRRVNTANTTLTVDQFVRTVRTVGGPAAARTARKYITTSALPDRFDAFASVYGYEDPRLRRDVVRLTAIGPRRNRSLERTDFIRIGVNETLRATVRVSNVGETRGLARIGPLVSPGGGSLEPVATPWVGWLAPGELVTRTATHRFDGPGVYQFSVGPQPARSGVTGDQIFTVVVVPNRNTASVVGLTATANATADERVDVTVRLRNDGSRATFVRLPVSVGGDRVTTLTLVLGGGNTRTVTVQVPAPAGAPVVAVGDTETVVGATSSTTTPSPDTDPTQTSVTPETAGSPTTTPGPDTDPTQAGTTPGTAGGSTERTVPGFGVVTVLVVVVLAVLRRRAGGMERR